MSETVKIRLSPETRNLLKGLGRKGQSYDLIIRALLRFRSLRLSSDEELLELWAGCVEAEAEG